MGVKGIAMQDLSFSDLTETKAITELQREPTVNPCSTEYGHMLQGGRDNFQQIATDIT